MGEPQTGQSSPSIVRTTTKDERTERGRRAWKAASRAGKHMSKHSKIVNPKLERLIPRFDHSEVIVGKLLGSGGFNNVYELDGLQLLPDPRSSQHARKISSEIQMKTRLNVASNCCNEESSKFAIKFLSRDTLKDTDRYCTGAADLVVEAKFLASLSHPNIVGLRGMAAAGTSGFSSCKQMGYFLLLDKLSCTLDTKIEEWIDQDQKASGALQRKILDRSGRRQKNLLADRLNVAFDIASALQFLHRNQIIYRDLKPDNVGFDCNGTVKIFDFGLAKELDDTMRTGYCHELYELSGNTGSLRYMAPEVALSQPYNLTADVYSFGLLLWQMCSLELPYDGMSRSDHAQYVVDEHQRPTLNPTWSTPLRILIKRAWEPDPSLRPSMDSTHKILKREINSLRDADGITIENTRTRSRSQVRERSTRKLSQQEAVNSAVERRGSFHNVFKKQTSCNRISLVKDVPVGKMLEKTSSSRAPIKNFSEQKPSARNPVAA